MRAKAFRQPINSSRCYSLQYQSANVQEREALSSVSATVLTNGNSTHNKVQREQVTFVVRTRVEIQVVQAFLLFSDIHDELKKCDSVQTVSL